MGREASHTTQVSKQESEPDKNLTIKQQKHYQKHAATQIEADKRLFTLNYLCYFAEE